MKHSLVFFSMLFLLNSACQKTSENKGPPVIHREDPTPPEPAARGDQVYKQILKDRATDLVRKKNPGDYDKHDYELLSEAFDQTNFYSVFIDKVATDPLWTKEILNKDTPSISNTRNKKVVVRIQMVILAAALDDSEIRCEKNQETSACEAEIGHKMKVFEATLQAARKHWLNLKIFLKEQGTSSCGENCGVSISTYLYDQTKNFGDSSPLNEVWKAFANIDATSRSSRWSSKYNDIYQELLKCIDQESFLSADIQKTAASENVKQQSKKIDSFGFNCIERPIYFSSMIPFWNAKSEITKTRQKISNLLSIVDQSSQCGGIPCAKLVQKGVLP